MNIQIKRLRPGVNLPQYMTAGAVGFDLSSALKYPVRLYTGERVAIPTGLAFAIPPGFEGQVRGRSGLAKRGVMVTNAPGTIDSDYRGEVHVLLINLGVDVVTFAPGDRIGQMVIAPVVRAELVECEELPATERGAGGFGSTGVR